MRTLLVARSKKFLDRLIKGKSDIHQIVLYCTDICNLNCKYCSRGLPFQREHKSYRASDFAPWIHFLVKEGIRFGTISITGGEPFLHPDIFGFIDETKAAFPDKATRIITNFSWANENSIKDAALKLNNLDTVVISKYPAVIERSGGEERFGALVQLLRESCPHLRIDVREQGQFIAWELRKAVEPVGSGCVSDVARCPALGPTGIVTRCAVSSGAKNIREYRPILDSNTEYRYDLTKWDKKEFLDFVHRYPFDLCLHCSLWRGHFERWTKEDRITQKALTPA